MGSVSQEENVGNVNNRGAGDSIEVPPGYGFEVGDMVWGKVKSHPWWPGHVYSEEIAPTSVRGSKRDGLLLVAFFGDSSYGWFDPSDLIPFDSNFTEKSLQTSSRTFVKALEEAIDEVRRRSALGLSCICRNKLRFRQTDRQGFLAVDVVGYERGAVYSINTIKKARESFKPRLAVDFVRELALEPTNEHDDIDFIKNKATVMAYRSAVYEEFDETYDQAFGGVLVRPSPGSIHGKKPPKAPLSGRQVFGDTVGKLKTPLNKPKKDKYIFKRRDEPKQTKTLKVNESTPPTIEDPIIATLKLSTLLPQSNNPDFEINTPICSLIHKSSNLKKFVTQIDIPTPGPIKKRKKESLAIEVAGELNSGKSVSPEEKKKRKKESLMAEYELPNVLADLHLFALDPLYTNNKKLRLKVREVFLKFRSLVFQKSVNSVPENEPKSKFPVTGAPPVKRPEDPTKGGIKRDRHEEIAVKKKKIKKKTDENGGQEVARESGQRAAEPEPTILKMEFPSGGSLPSISELKVKLGRFGSMDHDGTRIYWKTFTCLVVYKYKADAEVALKAVAGGCNLFGNTDVKYSLKEVSDSEPPVKVREDLQPAVENRAALVAADLPLKSCLKKSGGDDGGRKTSRVKFNFTGDENHNSKNFQKGVSRSTTKSTPPPPPPPTSPPLASPPPPRNSMCHSAPFETPSLPPPRSMPVVAPPLPPRLNRPVVTPLSPPPLASPPPPRNSMNYRAPFEQTPRSMPLVAPPLPPRLNQPVVAPPLPPRLNRPVVAPLSSPPLASSPPPRNSMSYSAPFESPSLPPPCSMPVVALPLPPRLNRPVGATLPPPPPPPNMDIAQQMVSLLTRCNDVVAHVTGILGYVPYHPL